MLHILFTKILQLVTLQKVMLELSMSFMMKLMNIKMMKIMSGIITWCSTLWELMNLKRCSMEMMLQFNQTISTGVKLDKTILFKSMDVNLLVPFLSMMRLVLMQFLRSTRMLKLLKLLKEAVVKLQMNLYFKIKNQIS